MLHARRDYDPIQDPRGQIGKDEPVFLVRAKDVCAPATAEAWANLAEIAGCAPAFVQAVRDHAKKMHRWGETHGTKRPDAPEGSLR